MRPTLMRPFIEFARTIRFSHTLFALPFALGTALLAEPPCPEWRALALLVACMVAARTAAMGMNRVADAALDARNPRTRDRAIPAGRLSRRAALTLTLASGAAFIALAWLFLPLRRSVWPGVLAGPMLAVLFGYSWTKRFTVLTHWVLGLCLGLAPVGVWIALRGGLDLPPVLIGAAVTFWTAGFDILYALQDMEVDRREGLYSIPAKCGRRRAQALAAASHAAAVLALAVVFLAASGCIPALVPTGARGLMGPASLAALTGIAAALGVQHLLARRAAPERIAARFLWLNAMVSVLWLAGAIIDMAIREHH